MVSDLDVIAAQPNWPIMLRFGILLLAIAFGPVDRAILPVFALMSILFFSRRRNLHSPALNVFLTL
jgi:hypothetical protein